jgi:hypothetical protein
MGVSIEQWRMQIGTFTPKCIKYLKNKNDTQKTYNINTSNKNASIIFVLYIICTLLVISGVETNPGPFDKEAQDYLVAFENRICDMITGYKTETISAINNM